MAEKRKTKIGETPTPFAIGDDAIAAGMPVVPSGDLVKNGEDEINRTRDFIAQRAKRTSPTIDIYVQTAAPAHAAGRVWIHPA
ncbi:hypothetical protein [Microbacterium sp. P5_E9]